MSAEKTCPGAHFKYFAHCERCKWSEAIMLDVVADPWPKCEVCTDAMTVFAIGAPLAPLPLQRANHQVIDGA